MDYHDRIKVASEAGAGVKSGSEEAIALVHVVDGETLVVRWHGTEERIRLRNVDMT